MNKKQIASLLRDYHWMINEIKRQRKLLEDAGEGLTAQYGIESVMPKGNGGNSDPVAREAIRRHKKSKWVGKLEGNVLFIQSHIACISNEREKAVLECLLDGMSMIAISQHMGLSRRHIYNLRDAVVDRIAENAHNAHIAGKLQTEKRCG